MEQQTKLKSEQYQASGGINTKVSQYVQGQNEFLSLQNFDFSVPGALSQRPGTTLIINSGISLPITGVYDLALLSGFSAIIITQGQTASILKYSPGPTLSGFKSLGNTSTLFDFTTFVNRMFASNGNDFFKFDGFTPYPVGLPSFDLTNAFLGHVFPFLNYTTASTIVPPVGASNGTFVPGTYVYAFGYLNERGYYGSAIMNGDYLNTGLFAPVFGITVVIGAGVTQVAFYWGNTYSDQPPNSFGATALVVYRSGPGGLDEFLIGYGFSAGVGQSHPFFFDQNLPLTTLPAPQIFQMTLSPSYLEIYNNSLNTAGYSGFPSTLFPSQVGEPESIDYTISNEIRTNDGDIITGMKSFQNYLVIFKKRSFHLAAGFDPNNYSIQQVSDQYGCVSNQAVVVYNQTMLFLDQKGVCMFDGANVSIMSNKVEPIFLRMNLQAANQKALAIHVRFRNEVWFLIPVDGSTKNNLIVVFDYLINAWTTYSGPLPSYITLVNSQYPYPTITYGDYIGKVKTFGASFLTDSGATITCSYQTHFLRDMGESIEKQWRRLYLNIDPALDPANYVNIGLYADYNSSSAVIGTTMPLAPFQNRIDFGIPAKSFSHSLSYASGGTGTIRIYGYTVESRYQRAT